MDEILVEAENLSTSVQSLLFDKTISTVDYSFFTFNANTPT